MGVKVFKHEPFNNILEWKSCPVSRDDYVSHYKGNFLSPSGVAPWRLPPAATASSFRRGGARGVREMPTETSEMLARPYKMREPFSDLPRVFKSKMQKSFKERPTFSEVDNKHAFDKHGEWLGMGYGVKKYHKLGKDRNPLTDALTEFYPNEYTSVYTRSYDDPARRVLKEPSNRRRNVRLPSINRPPTAIVQDRHDSDAAQERITHGDPDPQDEQMPLRLPALNQTPRGNGDQGHGVEDRPEQDDVSAETGRSSPPHPTALCCCDDQQLYPPLPPETDIGGEHQSPEDQPNSHRRFSDNPVGIHQENSRCGQAEHHHHHHHPDHNHAEHQDSSAKEIFSINTKDIGDLKETVQRTGNYGITIKAIAKPGSVTENGQPEYEIKVFSFNPDSDS